MLEKVYRKSPLVEFLKNSYLENHLQAQLSDLQSRGPSGSGWSSEEEVALS